MTDKLAKSIIDIATGHPRTTLEFQAGVRVPACRSNAVAIVSLKRARF